MLRLPYYAQNYAVIMYLTLARQQIRNKGPFMMLRVKFSRFVPDSSETVVRGAQKSRILFGFFSFFKVDIGKSLFCICFWLFKVPIAVEFLNTVVVCAIFPSLSLGAIWREDAIVYVLSFDKGMLNSISFVI